MPSGGTEDVGARGSRAKGGPPKKENGFMQSLHFGPKGREIKKKRGGGNRGLPRSHIHAPSRLRDEAGEITDRVW